MGPERRTGIEERRLDSDGQLRIAWPVVVQVVAYVIAVMLTYAAMSARVAVVETKQLDLGERLNRMEAQSIRIESKIDRVWDRVK